MAKVKKIQSNTADIIGYWARIHNLAFADIEDLPQLAGVFDTDESHEAFKTGFEEASEEIEAEALAIKQVEFLTALREAGVLPCLESRHGA